MAGYPELAGRTVVVTGGSRGIGAGVVGAIAAEGGTAMSVRMPAEDRERLADGASWLSGITLDVAGGRITG
ncbi:hypothetical protein OG389_26625 [Streptomyces sp. NBC_00435]|uniref:hypothetical protein n=1 Tax=Streptomyces sp. NBC_00435 TaxID=2903649 RepID=UPI002E2012E8